MGRPSAVRLGARVGQSPLHMVSAWSVENHLTLGQVATDAKSNEITAIPELLKLLDLEGAIVTIDAMGCQKDIAAGIVQGGGEFVLAVKENQPHLYEDIQQAFEETLEHGEPGVDFTEFQTEEVRRGRPRDPHMLCDHQPQRHPGHGPVDQADGDLHGSKRARHQRRPQQ